MYELLVWKRLMQELGLGLDLWDVEGQRGVSVDLETGERHQESWVGRYGRGVMVMPIYDLPQLELLEADDLVGSGRVFEARPLLSLRVCGRARASVSFEGDRQELFERRTLEGVGVVVLSSLEEDAAAALRELSQ